MSEKWSQHKFYLMTTWTFILSFLVAIKILEKYFENIYFESLVVNKRLCNLWSVKLFYGIVGTYLSRNESPFFGASVKFIFFKYKFWSNRDFIF